MDQFVVRPHIGLVEDVPRRVVEVHRVVDPPTASVLVEVDTWIQGEVHFGEQASGRQNTPLRCTF